MSTVNCQQPALNAIECILAYLMHTYISGLSVWVDGKLVAEQCTSLTPVGSNAHQRPSPSANTQLVPHFLTDVSLSPHFK